MIKIFLRHKFVSKKDFTMKQNRSNINITYIVGGKYARISGHAKRRIPV